jgi:uncharacterized delta-60 repeat protein
MRSRSKPQLKSLPTKTLRRARRPACFKPRLELLETRTLLAAGALDASFGVNGILRTSAFANGAADTMAVQSDGKIVLVGVATTAALAASTFTVARFDAAGNPDPSFGSGGFVSTQFPGSASDQAAAVAIQTDGRIVVAGTTRAPSSGGNGPNFGLIRYTAAGAVDPSFGNNGFVVINFSSTTGVRPSIASCIALQPDGKIVVGGTSQGNVAVARANADGSQDPDFDADGKVFFNIGATLSGTIPPAISTDGVNAIGIEPDGKIVAAGFTNLTSDHKELDLTNNFAVFRFNGDGTLDASFAGGIMVDDFLLTPTSTPGQSPYRDEAFALAFQPDGKIIAAGRSDDEVAGAGAGNGGTVASDNFAMARYNTDGSLDRTFTPDGEVVTDFVKDFTPNSEDQINSVTLQVDGKILAAGFTQAGEDGLLGAGEKNFAQARYNPDGTLDQSYGFHGKVITNISSGQDDAALNIAALPTGNILMAGSYNGAASNLALARYSGIQAGTLQLSATAYSVQENAGSITITVNRINGNDGTLTATLGTTDNTAKAGVNYGATTATITMLSGETTKTVKIPIIDDQVFTKGNLTFNVNLTNPADGLLLGSAVVTIVETDTAPAPSPGQSANQDFVSQAYRDLLGREVDPTGLTVWTNLLAAGGTPEQVAAGIVDSTEFRTVEVQNLYMQYLHRAADQTGLTIFVNALAGGATFEQISAALVGSPEYFQNRGGGTNDGFLSALYQDALGRAIDPAGQAGFSAALANGVTTAQVAAIIFNSPEYQQVLVEGYYQKYLHRSADAAGLAFFTSQFGQTTRTQQPIFAGDQLGQSGQTRDEDIIAQIVGSPEYFAKNS